MRCDRSSLQTNCAFDEIQFSPYGGSRRGFKRFRFSSFPIHTASASARRTTFTTFHSTREWGQDPLQSQ